MLLTFLGFYYYQNFLVPCASPLEYSIGAFDQRFGISRDRFIQNANSAEGIWENSLAKKELFKYNPESTFKINLIYDSRQLTLIAKQKTEFGLSSAENTFKALDRQFNTLKTDYENLISLHENRVEKFILFRF